MNKKTNIRHLTLISLAISLNIIGAFVAYSIKLPIYLDSVGTILIACLLGPKYAVITGVCGSIISGMTFDPYSIYFAPVQISTGLFSGLMYQKGFLSGKKTPLGVLIFAVPTALASAVVSAYVFGGVTSSGSSYIVQILSVMQVPTVVGVFITQIITDYIDKFVAVAIVHAVVVALPREYKLSINSSK